MNKILLILSFTLLSHSTFARNSQNFSTQINCELPRNETITIGCTSNCGRFNRWALKWYGRKLGYKIKTLNLRSPRQSIDYTQVDGIIIPGGSDIDPKWYINKVTPQMREYLEKVRHLAELTQIGERRDLFEFDLLKKYFKNPL